jgi:hypothetical protein
MGVVLLAEDNWTEAESLFDEALAMRDAMYEGRHFEVALSRASLAEAQWRSGETESAAEKAESALALARSVNAPPHVLAVVRATHDLIIP